MSPSEAPNNLAVAPDPAQQKRLDYNRLVRTAKLLSLHINNVNFNVSPDAMALDKESFKRDLLGKVEILDHGVDGGLCIANITWRIRIRSHRRLIVKCSASYFIAYSGMTNFAPDMVEIFVENVGKPATYTYFRALYAHLDWSADLGSPPIPIMQFQAKGV